MSLRRSHGLSIVTIGALLTLTAGVLILMGIITAETQYPPGYSTAENEISDLGATRPPHSIIHQPSARIFDGTMIVTGAMLIAGAACLHAAHRRKLVTVPQLLMGVGVLGVGVFPGNHHPWHLICALTAFLFGGLAATFSYSVTGRPFRYVALVLGLTSLFFLFFGAALEGTLGAGGRERWLAYPVVLWMVGYGGYILGSSSYDFGTATESGMEAGSRGSP